VLTLFNTNKFLTRYSFMRQLSRQNESEMLIGRSLTFFKAKSNQFFVCNVQRYNVKKIIYLTRLILKFENSCVRFDVLTSVFSRSEDDVRRRLKGLGIVGVLSRGLKSDWMFS
jgi:hypothetical protein